MCTSERISEVVYIRLSWRHLKAFEIPSIEDMMKPIFVLSLIIVQVFATSRGDTSLSAVKSAFDAANV